MYCHRNCFKLLVSYSRHVGLIGMHICVVTLYVVTVYDVFALDLLDVECTWILMQVVVTLKHSPFPFSILGLIIYLDAWCFFITCSCFGFEETVSNYQSSHICKNMDRSIIIIIIMTILIFMFYDYLIILIFVMVIIIIWYQSSTSKMSAM